MGLANWAALEENNPTSDLKVVGQEVVNTSLPSCHDREGLDRIAYFSTTHNSA